MRQIRRFAMCLALLLVPGTSVAAQRTPNASDQSNDEGAVKLAAKIRRALVKDKSLSVRAHNITIIVKEGTVTLRGMVDSGHERQEVHQKVQRIAGSMQLNDLLTVKQ
jgi:hyperosmotically inducible periplasmic protein